MPLPRIVKDIMRRKVVTIEDSRPLIDAARLMVKKKSEGKGIGSVVVKRRGKVVGILTERDFIEKVSARGLNVRKAKIKDVMSHPVVTCTPNMLISRAAELMYKRKVRHLPVLKGNRLVGIVASYDLVTYGWTCAVG